MAEWANGLAARVVSAVVLMPLAVGAIHFGSWPFIALVLASAILMAWEWQDMTGGPEARSKIVAIFCIIVPSLVLLTGRPQGALVALIAIAALLLVGCRLANRPGHWLALGIVYVGLPVLTLLWLRDNASFGRDGVYWLFCAVWATDIGAYLAGRTIGGPKLASRISPKKTWAGLIGGALAAGLAGGTVSLLTDFGTPLRLGVGGLLIALVAQAGDLAESAVKRHFGRKDSGSLIPGHGGILDRVDGVVFAAPALALYVLMGGVE